MQGVTPEFLAIRSLEIDYGSFISTNDLDKRNRVCVIGTTVAENLFENQNPVGQTIRIKNQPFKVIGLLKSKGQSSMGQDQDDMVVVEAVLLEHLVNAEHIGLMAVVVPTVAALHQYGILPSEVRISDVYVLVFSFVGKGFLDLRPVLGGVQALLGQGGGAFGVADLHDDGFDHIADLDHIFDLLAVLCELFGRDDTGLLGAQVNADLGTGDLNNGAGDLVSVIYRF